MHYVYIRLTGNSQLYTGYTSDLKRRFSEHQAGKVKATANCLPVKRIHYEAYSLKTDAQRRERYLKTTEGKRFLSQQIRDILQNIGYR